MIRYSYDETIDRIMHPARVTHNATYFQPEQTASAPLLSLVEVNYIDIDRLLGMSHNVICTSKTLVTHKS